MSQIFFYQRRTKNPGAEERLWGGLWRNNQRLNSRAGWIKGSLEILYAIPVYNLEKRVRCRPVTLYMASMREISRISPRLGGMGWQSRFLE